MPPKTTPKTQAACPTDPASLASDLEAAQEIGDPELIAAALEEIARAKTLAGAPRPANRTWPIQGVLALCRQQK